MESVPGNGQLQRYPVRGEYFEHFDLTQLFQTYKLQQQQLEKQQLLHVEQLKNFKDHIRGSVPKRPKKRAAHVLDDAEESKDSSDKKSTKKKKKKIEGKPSKRLKGEEKLEAQLERARRQKQLTEDKAEQLRLKQ
eukprot:Pgem_evm1s15077